MDRKEPADLTTRVLAEIRAELRGQGATLTQVLRAVEHGNAQRDERVLDHELRIARIEKRIGIPQ